MGLSVLHIFTSRPGAKKKGWPAITGHPTIHNKET